MDKLIITAACDSSVSYPANTICSLHPLDEPPGFARLVAKIVPIPREPGREITTTDEARRIIGLGT